MKPFDIELAKQGKPVRTRDGRPVRILCYDFITPENTPIIAVVKLNDKQEKVYCYKENGGSDLGGKSTIDLMMATEKKEGWINIYKCGITSYIYPTEKQALSNVDPEGYLATIKIEWQE